MSDKRLVPDNKASNTHTHTHTGAGMGTQAQSGGTQVRKKIQTSCFTMQSLRDSERATRAGKK